VKVINNNNYLGISHSQLCDLENDVLNGVLPIKSMFELLKETINNVESIQDNMIEINNRVSMNEANIFEVQRSVIERVIYDHVMTCISKSEELEVLEEFLNEINDIVSATIIMQPYVFNLESVEKLIHDGRCSDLLKKLYLEVELKKVTKGD